MNDNIRKKGEAYMQRFPSVVDLRLVESPAKNKRLRARFLLDGKPKSVDFGLRGAHTYADGAPPEKRDSYRARAGKIRNKKGELTFDVPGTANSLSYWILW